MWAFVAWLFLVLKLQNEGEEWPWVKADFVFWADECTMLFSYQHHTTSRLDRIGQICSTCTDESAFQGCVDICKGQLRVNSQPITVAGANVHEMHPTRGKAVTEEDMLVDIKRLMLDCIDDAFETCFGLSAKTHLCAP